MKKTPTNKTNDYLDSLSNALINQQVNSRALIFSLDEFQRLYVIMTNKQRNLAPQISIVSIGDTLFLQFSNISPQHFIIVDPKGFDKDDFAFIPNINWYGPKEKTRGFYQFITSEFKLNWKLFCVIFLISSIILFFTKESDLYIKVSELVLQAMTVFLSIFLIFTVSQNQIIASDKKLFIEGIVQQFFSDDLNLAKEAILTIILALFNTILVHFLNRINLDAYLIKPNLLLHDFILAFTTSSIILLLIDTFLSVVNYFFLRTKNIHDRNMASTILDEEFLKYHDNN